MNLKVHGTAKNHVSGNEITLYATGADFCRIFKEEMNSLYLLSLLLTADSERAQECLVSGLDDCSGGNQVFKEWARSWARRAIVKNAIRLMTPEPAGGSSKADVAGEHKSLAANQMQAISHAEIAAVLQLAVFDRFAFVLSVLERYSDHECAVLLACTRESLVSARVRALQQLGRAANSETVAQGGSKVGAILTMEAPRRLATSA